MRSRPTGRIFPPTTSPPSPGAGPPAPGDVRPLQPDRRPTTSAPSAAPRSGRMPVFTWNPIPGAMSYFVVVAKDPFFTTIADYAYTRVTAYAPRTGSQTKGYADETSDYYWAVLPPPDGQRPRSLDGPGAGQSPAVREAGHAAEPARPHERRRRLERRHGLPLDARLRGRALPPSGLRRSDVRQRHPGAVGAQTAPSPTRPPTRAAPPTRPARRSTGASRRRPRTDLRLRGLRWSTTGTFQRAAGARAEPPIFASR